MSGEDGASAARDAKVREVGIRIKEAREARRLSIREAANRTVTTRGSLTDFTWGRIEKSSRRNTNGTLTLPQPITLAAMAEVVGLDGDELCLELGLVPPPPRERALMRRSSTEEQIEEIQRALDRLRGQLRQERG